MEREVDSSKSYLDGLNLDRQSSEPLYVQVAEAIRSAIRQGLLSDGLKLPSTREASERLSVNRVTVVEAYRVLRDEGWVRSGVGAGTFVVRRNGGEEATGEEEMGSSFWSAHLNSMPRPECPRISQLTSSTIRLTSPTADPDAFPAAEFKEILDEILLREGASCLDYGPSDGYAPLRAEIAAQLAAKGAPVDPSRVLLVNGSQQGLDLVLRLVAGVRGLLVEEPTYNLALRAARALRLSIRGIPVDDEGIRVDILEQRLDERAAGMVYVMPVFQNPTGVCLSPARRARLLEVTRERGVAVVEDHFDAELDYAGNAPPPLLADGAPPNVVLLGTFSKILFPGLRVGWVVVPEPLIGPFSEAKVCADLSGALLTQIALHEFCKRGLLGTHLERIRRRNRSRLDAMLSALDSYMAKGVRWTRPTGGMCVWMRLPRGFDADLIAAEALRRGVAGSSGSAFYLDAADGRHGIRLCFIRESEERIRTGIRILADTINEGIARSGAHNSEGAAAPIL
jgi:2-aminoadipate transaminase